MELQLFWQTSFPQTDTKRGGKARKSGVKLQEEEAHPERVAVLADPNTLAHLDRGSPK